MKYVEFILLSQYRFCESICDCEKCSFLVNCSFLPAGKKLKEIFTDFEQFYSFMLSDIQDNNISIFYDDFEICVDGLKGCPDDLNFTICSLDYFKEYNNKKRLNHE